MSLSQNRLVKYLLEAKGELKKVTWPTKKETLKHTLIVIGVSLFTAFFLGMLDLLFSKIMTRLV